MNKFGLSNMGAPLLLLRINFTAFRRVGSSIVPFRRVMRYVKRLLSVRDRVLVNKCAAVMYSCVLVSVVTHCNAHQAAIRYSVHLAVRPSTVQ